MGGLCPLVYPPAQVFEVSDAQKNYHRVSRLNVLNIYNIYCMLEDCVPTGASVASYL